MQRVIILSVLLMALQIRVFGQSIHKDSIKGNFIEFGNGGGFTGQSKNYVLTRSGDLYFIKNILADEHTLEYLKKVKSCTVKKIFRYAEKNKITELRYNNPGNLFQYMTLIINNKTNRLVWESSDSATPENIITLYTRLYNLL
jgi:hypothetical protein